MFEIEQVGEKTFFIKNATNIGLFLENESDVWIIDSGIDSDTGKKILKAVNEKEWTVKGVIYTHYHADHVGGNKLIKDRTGCKILACGVSKTVCENPLLNATFVYGAYPISEICSKFFLAKPTEDVLEAAENLPDGLELFELPGHAFDMIGIKTSDDVYFLADSLVSEITTSKYHIFFLYDIGAQLETLDKLKVINDGKNDKTVFIPAHCEMTDDISGLIEGNRSKIHEIADVILSAADDGQTVEEIVRSVFIHYDLKINATQHALLTSTVKSYLSWLQRLGKVTVSFEDNYMLFRRIYEQS